MTACNIEKEIKDCFLRQKIASYIRANGPIPTARVSSVQARGKARNYPYWDAVRYQVRVSKAGKLINSAVERATSSRRSIAMAEKDLSTLCEAENRLQIQTIGVLTTDDLIEVYQWITKK